MSRDAETTEQIKAIAQELSTATGEEIGLIVSDYWQDEIHLESGAILAEKSNNRFIFYPARPAWLKNNVHVSKDGARITCGANRDPEAIAQDITRRLLPEAREYWQACEKAQARHDATVKQVATIAQELESHGAKVQKWSSNDEHKTLTSTHTVINLYSSGISEMKISSPTTQQAIQILKILGDSNQ